MEIENENVNRSLGAPFARRGPGVCSEFSQFPTLQLLGRYGRSGFHGAVAASVIIWTSTRPIAQAETRSVRRPPYDIGFAFAEDMFPGTVEGPTDVVEQIIADNFAGSPQAKLAWPTSSAY
jgi:hypothetical protein